MLRQAQHELSNTARPELVVLRQAQHERGICGSILRQAQNHYER